MEGVKISLSNVTISFGEGWVVFWGGVVFLGGGGLDFVLVFCCF